MFGSNLAATD